MALTHFILLKSNILLCDHFLFYIFMTVGYVYSKIYLWVRTSQILITEYFFIDLIYIIKISVCMYKQSTAKSIAFVILKYYDSWVPLSIPKK